MIALNCFGSSLKQRFKKACETGDYKTLELLVKSSSITDDQIIELFKVVQETDFETKQIKNERDDLYWLLIKKASDESIAKICDILHDEMVALKTQIQKKIEMHNQYTTIKTEERTQMMAGCDQQIYNCSYDIELLSSRLDASYLTFNLAARGLSSTDAIRDVWGFRREIQEILKQSKLYRPSKAEAIAPLKAFDGASVKQATSRISYAKWSAYQC